jgi:hypothetical protein
MHVSAAPAHPPRAADNELYDRGCDLVQAAAAIRESAGSPEAARAVPAVLGCIEAAMHELLWATVVLEETTARHVRQEPHADPRLASLSERMRRGYANLEQALADAERAGAAARPLVGRALTALQRAS